MVLQRFLLLILLLHGSAYAQLPVIVLDADIKSVSLASKMLWLQDKPAILSPDQAFLSQDWQPLAGEPGFSFTPAAIWLRFEVVQVASSETSWRLEVNNALLEDVRLYLRTTPDSWQEQRSGRAVPHSDWPLNTRSPVFALELTPGTHDVMLRLATRNSLSTSVRLWQAEHYYSSARNEAMLWGVYFGLYTLIILIQFMLWKWTKEALSGWYAPYAGLNLLGVLMTMGYPQSLFGWGGGVMTNLMGVFICTVVWLGCKFSSVQLELDKMMPRMNRLLLRTAAVMALLGSVLVLAGNYSLGVSIGQFASIIFIFVVFGISILLLYRGHTPTRFFLAAFSIFYLGILIRYLRNLGILEPGVLTDYSIQIGSLLHMLAMCFFIVYRYNALKVALGIEQKARQEQQDFVAMVSHEYRTPLAIISTSIQQLAANLDAPQEKSLKRCSNIRNAVGRMNDLLDKYLSSARLEEANQPLQVSHADPQELIKNVVSEWPPERIKLVLSRLPSVIVCDRSLLEVALRNLLTNADRHSAPDSVIEVIGTSDGKRGLRIAVVNTGEKIPSDELHRLFQKYFRGRASRGKPGAGLGLFLVKRIIDLHGGRISVTSKNGKTTFEISLPDIVVDYPAESLQYN